MHKHRQIVALSWQDKKVVSFLSTASHAWQPGNTVDRRIWRKQFPEKVPTIHVHLQYQEMMRGFDVTDQLRGNYTVQLATYKWWHKALGFVIDQLITNCYIIYRDEMELLGLRLLLYMDFQLAITDHLIGDTIKANWRRKKPLPVKFRNRPGCPLCAPDKGTLRRLCVVCGSK
jgi:hypothetical protein